MQLGIVEVKCPYCAKDQRVSEVAKENGQFTFRHYTMAHMN